MNEFIKQDDDIILNAAFMEAYVDTNLFSESDEESDSAIAMEYGEGFKLMGIFNVRIFQTDEVNETLRKKTMIQTFNYPNIIETYPTSHRKNVKMQLSTNDETDEGFSTYRVLQYFKGDIIMSATSKESSKNCEKFISMLTKGKIPTTIPYKDLLHVWRRNYGINGLSPDLPLAILEAMIATLCRYAEDPSIPYRMKAALDMEKYSTNYIAANMREVTSFINVMSALTFEDMGSMLTTSINMSRSGKPQTKSPFEEILTV